MPPLQIFRFSVSWLRSCLILYDLRELDERLSQRSASSISRPCLSGKRPHALPRENPTICIAKRYCDWLPEGDRFSQRSLTVLFLTFGILTPLTGSPWQSDRGAIPPDRLRLPAPGASPHS